MKIRLVVAAFVFSCAVMLSGCRKEKDIIPQVPIGKAYLTFVKDGIRQTLIEGENGVTSLNLYGYNTESENYAHGGGVAHGKSTYSFFFFFTPEEFRANTGNFTGLFGPKKLPYLQLNRQFKFVNDHGIRINFAESLTDSTGKYTNSDYQENVKPQSFEVTDAYFYNTTYDRFIWVEGKFDCQLGFFDDLKPVSGEFRIKVQHNDE